MEQTRMDYGNSKKVSPDFQIEIAIEHAKFFSHAFHLQNEVIRALVQIKK